MTTAYRNARTAFVEELYRLNEYGKTIDSRNGNVKELIGATFVIQRPWERCILVAKRNDNIFHKIAESMWVLAGRNDTDWLSAYLPSAANWADDGKHWRAGYGPRLRRWKCETDIVFGGVDQVSECIRLLKVDPLTRRAVMTIFDPELDYCDSKDIPCNNWIQFLLRDGSLHMLVSQRSSDIWFGFSGINAFEWYVLHAYMCGQLGCHMGNLIYTIGSLHIYERHWSAMQDVLNTAAANTWVTNLQNDPYDVGSVKPSLFGNIGIYDIERFFDIEQNFRSGIYIFDSLSDELLTNMLCMLRAYWVWKNNPKSTSLFIENMPDNDFKLAAIEFFRRQNVDLSRFPNQLGILKLCGI